MEKRHEVRSGRGRGRLARVLLCVMALSGCASHGAAPGEATDEGAGPADLARSFADLSLGPALVDAGGRCNQLAPDAPPIVTTAADDPMTAPQGGEIVPGLYYLTELRILPQSAATPGGTVSGEHYLTAETWQATQTTGAGVRVDSSARFSTSGSTLTLSYDCPTADVRRIEYDATPDQLVLYDTDHATVNVYRRQ